MKRIENYGYEAYVVGGYVRDYIMKDSDKDPSSIWKSEIFGRSLDNIIQEGIQAKLAMMPENIRYKLQTTLTKVVNKGSNNMIAIVI